jgi:integrase
VTVAPAVAKVCLWSWGRKSEVMGLRWDQLRSVAGEHHFEIVGKWGVDKWFRIPDRLYRELLALKTDSPYVFGMYKRQLRRFHERGPRPWLAQRVSDEFEPDNLGDWFYERVQEWSEGSPDGRAYLHVFRKTSLQYARSGEDLNRQVSADARLGEGVMMTSYVRETDEEMRAKSNRTYRRIAASLPPEVARRYGHEGEAIDPLVQRLQDAVARQEWGLVSRITAELQGREEAGPSP